MSLTDLSSCLAADANEFSTISKLTSESPISLWEALLLPVDVESVDLFRKVVSAIGSLSTNEQKRQIIINTVAESVAKHITLDLSCFWLVYFPIGLKLFRNILLLGDTKRVFVAIGGAAASSKTTFALILTIVINAIANENICATLSMDGYHFPNSVLEQKGLRAFKGSLMSFNGDAFCNDVLRIENRTEDFALPVYDRLHHEPVPGALHLGRQHAVVVVEGLFVLIPKAPWSSPRDKYDLAIYLHVPLEVSRHHASVRKAAGNGISMEEAYDHYDRVDRLNYDVISESRQTADFTIEFAEDRTVSCISSRH